MFTTVILVALLIVPPSQTRDVNGYIKTDDCKENHLCTYDYSVEVGLSNGEGVIISAYVKTVCDSVGIFRGNFSTLYCIAVSNVVVMLTNVTEEDRSGYSDDETQTYGVDMSRWFCFAQSTTGKILGVFYPKNENNEIVNFKKSIASTFQANFKGTTEEDEGDSQSFHRSHYRYYSKNSQQVQQRTVGQNDVIQYAGNLNIHKTLLHFYQEDKIEMDVRKRVYLSTGMTTVDIGDKAKVDEDNKEFFKNDTFNSSNDVPSLKSTTEYKLVLSFCEDDVSSVKDQSRHVRSLKSKGIADEIIAKRDQAKEDKIDMTELHMVLPSIDETLERITRGAESINEVAKLMMSWRRLLTLEAKNGPLPGKQPKLPELIVKLNETFTRRLNGSQERQVLYDLLSSEGSLKAQKALIEMLHYPLNEDESVVLLLHIALLSHVHPSTVKYLEKYLELSNDVNQLILSFATLGRHSNAEDIIVDVLSRKLEKAIKNYQITNDSFSVVHIIHALGNTGSKKMIPLLLPFLSSDQLSLQLPAIDALRTVSHYDKVQKAFIQLVKDSSSVEPIVEVIESLLFPFKQSVYFSEHPKDAGKSSTEKNLMNVLVNGAIMFHNVDLNKRLTIYLNFVDTPEAQQLLSKLQTSVTRSKRAFTTNWNDGRSIFNLVASQSSRTTDEQNYPCHRAYLWGVKLGRSKLHANAAAGIFGGVSCSGSHKLFVKGVAEVYVYGHTYKIIDVEYKNEGNVTQNQPFVTGYGKIRGITYNIPGTIPYTASKTIKLLSLQLFHIEIPFYIVGVRVSVYFTGTVTADLTFKISIGSSSVTTSVIADPTLTIKAGAYLKALGIYKIGVEVSASFVYSVEPKASVTLCDKNPVGDATVCYALETKRQGSISVYAWYQRKTCRVRKWKLKCYWKAKKKVSSLSFTWDLHKTTSSTKKCRICNCFGSVLGNFCGNQPGFLAPSSAVQLS